MIIEKSEGLNDSEKRLVKLGEKVFLGLWSYPNVYYEPAKELADLLVVCDNQVLIFSDKNIKFNTDIDLSTAWQRWERKAILESIDQLRRAEQRIINFPQKIFLDSRCAKPFPLKLPSKDKMKIHLIAIANGVTDACKKYFGNGSGSLMFSSNIEEMKQIGSPTEFCITDYDKNKTFVHVFDDYTFPFVLNELDTLKDFVEYLLEKERFVRNVKKLMYTGEEDLLYHYVQNFDSSRKCHVFCDETKIDIKKYELAFFEEDWNVLKSNPRYIAKQKENEVSYLWDYLIQKTAKNFLNGTIISNGIKDNRVIHEGAIKYMALEDRTYRRMLSFRMISAMDHYPEDKYSDSKMFKFATLIYNNTNTAYFLLQLNKLSSQTYQVYRDIRQKMLEVHAFCLKSKFTSEYPEKKLDRIIGIGIEPPKYSESNSEDFILLDCSRWSDEEQEQYENIRKNFKYWYTPINQFINEKTLEYPEVQIQKNLSKKIGRNEPCPCGSGKKYKKCCLNKSSNIDYHIKINRTGQNL